MTFRYSLKKRAYIALFFFFVSCQTYPHWELRKTSTDRPYYNSSRIYFSDENARGLELELDYGVLGLQMYVNVFSLEVPSLPDDPTLANVNVEIDGEQRVFIAHLFLGGQRLLLPDEARDLILETLLSGAPVTLSTGRYRSIIPPANIQTLYKKLF
jgi:hypothetical protein